MKEHFSSLSHLPYLMKPFSMIRESLLEIWGVCKMLGRDVLNRRLRAQPIIHRRGLRFKHHLGKHTKKSDLPSSPPPLPPSIPLLWALNVIGWVWPTSTPTACFKEWLIILLNCYEGPNSLGSCTINSYLGGTGWYTYSTK